MKILILGASGGVGRCLVGQAVAAGHTVRAVARGDLDVPATVIRGEVLRDDLRPWLEGTEVVLSALGQRRANLFPYSALRSPPDLMESVMHRLIPAMLETGVPRLLAVSAAGVGDSAPAMNWVMKKLVETSTIGVAYRDLAVMERLLAESELSTCAPRPVALTHGKLTGRATEVKGFGMTSFISRADVAEWMLRNLESGVGTPMIGAR